MKYIAYASYFRRTSKFTHVLKTYYKYTPEININTDTKSRKNTIISSLSHTSCYDIYIIYISLIYPK